MSLIVRRDLQQNIRGDQDRVDEGRRDEQLYSKEKVEREGKSSKGD